ncbi:lipopolysaccharide biosynthesis protein [Devosia sp.]|uniref:lipopolysaccharide biosynthesis protein n=1 Tax=Devosia sp. TaxID=1871048 RepID=UPI003A8CCBBD
MAPLPFESRNRVLLRSTLIYAPAIFLTRISALLLLIIATRLIDQDEYGLLTLVVSVGEMTDVAVTNWLRIALVRLGGKGTISRGSLALAARVLVITTVVAIALSVAAAGFIAPERAWEFSLAVSGYLVVGAVGRYALSVLQMQQRHSVYSMMEFLRAFLQLVLPVTAMLVFKDQFLTVSLASSLGWLIAGLVALALALPKTVPGPSRFSYRELFALGIPLIVIAVMGFGLNSAERVLLKVYYDAGAVAIFAAAYALARQPIDLVSNAINMGGFPEVVARFDADGPEAAASFLSHTMALMLRLTLPIAALLVALSSDIVQLVLPPEYHGAAAQLFPIIAFSVICANLTAFVYEVVILAHKRPILMVMVNAPGSVVTIGLSVLLIPMFSVVGAAFALAGGMLTSLIACIIVSERLTHIPVPWRDIMLSAGIAVLSGGTAYIASTLLADLWVIFRLGFAGAAGGSVFLALNAMLFPRETADFARRLRLRFSRS